MPISTSNPPASYKPMNNSIKLNIIGVAHTPFKQKFGIPRQPRLAPEIPGTIEIFSPYNREEAFRSIDEFSHLWVSFIFHEIKSGKWQPMVRPPRLGGNKKVGVFASRSTHRPNPLGLSVVKLEKVEVSNQQILLEISSHDLLDQTPIVDIKPYLPYSDAIANASNGYAPSPKQELYEVKFSAKSLQFIELWQHEQAVNLQSQLSNILSQDPRPAYSKVDPERQTYGMHLYNLDIQFSIENNCVNVDTIIEL